MAYLFNNGYILGKYKSISSNQSIYKFVNPQLNNIEWTTVGFVPIGTSNNSTFTVSSTLCPGSSYNIYLGNNLYLGLDKDNITLIPVNSDNLNFVIFSISQNENNLTVSKPFTGSMSSLPINSTFAITISNNWSSVGYNAPLPKILSNCNKCQQCSLEFNCSDVGICIPSTVVNPCSETEGLCDGKCFGKCQANATCVRSGTVFTCISSSTIPPIWVWIIILVIIALISCLIWYFLYRKKIIELNKKQEYISMSESFTTRTTNKPIPTFY